MTTVVQLEQAFESLRTAFRSVAQEFDKLSSQIDAGATLEETQGRIDYIRSQFDQLYTQVESLRAQALTIDPRPDTLIARFDNSLNVNRPTNYQALGTITTKAGQNTNIRNAETADKAAADQGPKTDSAGETTAQAQEARADGAQTQAPPVEPAAAPSVTNAQPTPTDTLPPAQAAPPAAGAPASTEQTLPEVTVTATRLPAAPAAELPEPQVRQTYYYKAISVTSTFSGGRFTQDIEGALLITPVRRILPVNAAGGGIDAAVSDTGQFESQAGGVTGIVPPTGFDVASLGANGIRPTDLPTNVGNLVPVPAGIPSVGPIAAAVPRLPGDPGVLAPALKNLPTSGGAQVGLFNTAVNTNIGAGISSGTPDADLTYTGSDGIVWDRINAERLRRGLPGLAAIGSPRPPDDRAGTQTASYQTQRET